jgi:hypothetical protein
VLSENVKITLNKLWPFFLSISAKLFIFTLQVAITGYVPGINDPDRVLSVVMICLIIEAFLLPATFITGFAHDIAQIPALGNDGKKI